MKELFNKSKVLALANTPLLAQENKVINLQPEGEGLAATLSTLSIGQIVPALLQLMLIIAAIVFFFILVVGGIQWIVSGGDKAQTEGARGRITAALVGLVIVFAAWAIMQLIGQFFNVDIFTLEIPSV